MGTARVLAAVLTIFGSGTAWAATYQVGPEREYTSLQQVVGLLNPGDLVEVDGDAVYPGGVTFTRAGTAAQPITIRGMRLNGNRPVLQGGVNTVAFTTPWPYSGPGADHYVFEGFAVTGGSSRCVFHQAADLVIRDVVVHDCPAQGILGADEGSGSLLLEYSEIYGCGDGGSRHQIYMATDEVKRPGSVFRMQHCVVHSGNGGNNVKSRAERNEIYFNWIEGAFYHELELIGPDGADPDLVREDSDVVGNVFVKRNNFSVTRVGGDGTGETNGRYRFVNNTFVSGSAAVFRIFDGIESIEMHNNVFFRDGGPVTVVRTVEANWVAGEQIAGSRNWVASGAAAVPAQWTETIFGALPGFENLAGNDLRPAAGSPLLDQGAAAPAGPPGFPFPDPLFPPALHPPMGQLQAPGTAEPRPVAGALDIGAFERPAASPPGIAVDARNTTGIADGSASYPYPTIGQAVAAAGSGDTIKVAQGHYNEAVAVNGVSLHLLGGFVGAPTYGSGPGDFTTRNPDPALTWIQGAAAAPVVHLTDAPDSTVEGFRLTGGRHGVLVDGFAWPPIVADVVITGCLIEDNGAENVTGGGVRASGERLVISNTTIRNNVGDSFAGVYLHGCSDILFEGNLVEGNVGHGDHGGGLAINGWGVVRNNVIRDNRIGETVGYGWGGGVILIEQHDQPTVMSGNVITGNFAPSAGGGVFVDEGAAAILDGELIVGNTAHAAGGGVYVDQSWDLRRSQAAILGCTIAGNTSAGWPGWGTGLFVQASDVTVRDSIFWHNENPGGYEDFAVVDGGTLGVSYTLSQDGPAGTGNLWADPLFADPAGGDYHLRSRTGRWDPNAAGWVADPEHSPAIDAGDPASPHALEPEPNGGRRNLGAFGNTGQASMSWPAASALLTVTRAGAGTGTVASDPTGIDCGGTCSAVFPLGATVTLTADAAPGSVFAGWSGEGCSGTGTCVVAMDNARTVTAAFGADPNGFVSVAVIPSVARLQGVGAFFFSRVEFFNAGSEPLAVELVYTPRRDISGTILRTTIAVPPRIQVEARDVLGTLFGVTDGFPAAGSLALGVPAGREGDLFAQSVVLARNPDGSEYGQFFPAIPVSRAIEAGERAFLATAVDAVRNRVNLGLVALGEGATIEVVPMDPVGVPLAGFRSYTLPAGGSRQINDLNRGAQGFGLGELSNYVVQVEVTAGGALAFISVLDGTVTVPGTSDPTTILPVTTGSTRQTLVGLGPVLGINEFAGSAVVTNLSTFATVVRADFYARDDGRPGIARSTTLNLAPGETRGFPDVVGELFDASGVGAVVLTSENQARFFATGREYAVFRDGQGRVHGTAGQLVPGFGDEDMLQPGRIYHLLGLRERRVGSAMERSNLLLFNPETQPCTVTVRLFDGATGVFEGQVVEVVPAGELRQLNRVVNRINTGQDGQPKRVELVADGPLFVSASRINKDGDPITILPLREEGWIP